MSHQFAKRWFTVDEYYRMAQAGILTENDRVELIEGEVIEMSPIGSRHAACVKRLNTLLNRLAGEQMIVSVQDPIYIDEFSEPEPDVALLQFRKDFYVGSHPTASNVLLIIEVADTSVEYERKKKLPLYAQAGIPEVWLAILPEDRFEIHTQPLNGKYQSVIIVRRGESIKAQTIADLSIPVDEILG
jgi:Uma2 family endonuclease